MNQTEYLAHHGVKGMQWHKRRYQREDGSLTEEGRAHYGVGERREKKEEPSSVSERKPLTEEEKQARREKVRKIIGITAAVAVTAIAAHKISKGLDKLDRSYTEALERGIDLTRPFKKDLGKERNMAYMVPKGAKIQRLSRFDEAKSKGHAYVTFDPEDNARYKGFFGKKLQGSALIDKALGKKTGTVPYIHDIVARENLLSPSKKDRINTFLSMYRDNPAEMGKVLGKYHTIEYHDRGKLPAFVYKRQYSKLRGTEKITKGYRTFVKAIGDTKNEKLRNEYFKRIREHGYNMIQDDQDSGRSGIRPSIVLDRVKSLQYNGKRELLSDEVQESLKKYGRRVSKQNRHREWL